jgi:hypothetical protein
MTCRWLQPLQTLLSAKYTTGYHYRKKTEEETGSSSCGSIYSERPSSSYPAGFTLQIPIASTLLSIQKELFGDDTFLINVVPWGLSSVHGHKNVGTGHTHTKTGCTYRYATTAATVPVWHSNSTTNKQTNKNCSSLPTVLLHKNQASAMEAGEPSPIAPAAGQPFNLVENAIKAIKKETSTVENWLDGAQSVLSQPTRRECGVKLYPVRNSRIDLVL